MRSVKFDALKVGELTANFMTPSALLTAKAAFVSNSTGHTHGWTTGGNWSPETFRKLQELRESMEADLEAMHFEDTTSKNATGGVAASPPPNGLGEHLGTVPQI